MRLVILHRHSGAELYSGEARSLAGICDEPEARTRAIDAWLDLYALGPDMQDGVASCRACNCVVMPCPEDATEPTVFCHSCAQGFLELLVSGRGRVSAIRQASAEGLVLPGWDCPQCRAFNGDAKEHLTACRACNTPRPDQERRNP